MADAEPEARASTRWRQAALALTVLVVVAGSAYKYVEKVRKPSRDGTHTKSAFLRWRDQIQGLERGEDIYQKYHYPNPPIQAMILYPLTELDGLTGALVWFFAKVAMAGLAVVWAFRLVESSGPSMPWAAKALTVVFAAHSILGDLSHGNVNIFIAFLVFLALELQRRGQAFSGGVALALAIACKVTPALFVPYFVWKRAWRMALGSLLGCGLWLFVVPGAVLGWQHNVTLLTSWFDTMVRPFVVAGQVTSEHANQSIPGLTFRLLTNQPSVTSYEEGDGTPHAEEYHNLADVGPQGAKWIVRGFQGAFALGVVLLCRPRPTRGRAYAAECSYIILGMLMFSERTWKHHGVVLLLPFAVLVAVAFDPGTRRGRRALVTAILGVVFFLIVWPSLAGGDLQDLALTYGSHTAIFLLLTLGIGLILADGRTPRETPPPATLL